MINDPYFDTSFCVDRLYGQYLKYGRIIVAVDFDSTIFDFHGEKHAYPKVIEIIRKCNQLGFLVTIFTASHKKRHPFIRSYAEETLGLQIASINKNPIDLPYGNDGKIFYNIFLDDRAGLFQAYETLRLTIEKIETSKIPPVLT